MIYICKLHWNQDVLRKYRDFMTSLSTNEDLKALIASEAMGFVRSIQQLPFLGTPAAATAIYYEDFIRKLVQHMHSQHIHLIS